MTDALAKDDADHVLASIRRLVTDRPAAPERFLLTPALRVVEAAPKPSPSPKFLHEAAAMGEALHISAAVAQSVHGQPSAAPVDEHEANDSVADDLSIARLLRGLARSEAPAILAETLAKSCDIAATEALEEVFARQSPPQVPVTSPREQAAAVVDAAPFVASGATPVTGAQAGDAIPPSALADEAFLREIVTDVLRQELQGELGERITRNMRKLVRREINRALSQLDYD